jgi:adenosine kinase
VGFDSVLSLAHQVDKDLFESKDFCFSLGAPYVCEEYSEELLEILPYIDVLFANEREAKAFAVMMEYETTDINEIALKIAKEKKDAGDRIVVITRGNKPVIVATDEDTEVITYPVDEGVQIVDKNGAGDAFIGGFLAQYIQLKNLETCIRCGIYTATECLKLPGAAYPKTESTFKA